MNNKNIESLLKTLITRDLWECVCRVCFGLFVVEYASSPGS